MAQKVKFMERKSRAEEVVNYIGEQILLDKWNPGDRIDDAAIAEELAVSRNSVREALSHLTALRALEKRQWLGYFIPQLTWEDIRHTLNIRMDLEILALKLFIDNPNSEAIETIEKSIHQSETDFMCQNLLAFEKSDYLIHDIIQQYCGNPWIPHFMKQTRFAVQRLRHIDKLEDYKQFGEVSIREHWELLTYIKERDKLKAVECMQHQIEHHWERLNKVLNKNEHLPTNPDSVITE